MVFSDYLKKQARHSALMQHMKTSKYAANKVTSSLKASKKESLMFLVGQMEEPMYA